MSTWSRTNRKTIDQRNEILPPTWCLRASEGNVVPVSASGVMRSDATRHAARAICIAITGAKEVVIAASFLLADAEVEQALLSVAKRGVRVYVLLATETRLEKEPREDAEFEQRALADHKRMLESLAGWALIRSAPSFHAKVVLVDPARGGRGFLLTANLTEEALARNEELVIELTAAEAQVAFEHLRWAMWEASDHELLEPGRLSVVAGALKRVPKPASRSGVVATLQEAGSLRTTALDLVRNADRAITVASFGWDAEHEVVRALCAKAKAGLKVTVLARVRPAAMPALLALAQAGARVVGYRWLHAKAIAVDDGVALVMSANLEHHGLDSGFELGVVLDGARAAALRDILRGWIATAPLELHHAPLLGEVAGEAQVWVDRKLVPFSVIPSASITGENVIAASADHLESEPPPLRRKFGLPQPAHTIELTWVVDAPRLAPKSKELDGKLRKSAKPDDPPVFREINGRVVVAVRSANEILRACEVMKEVGAVAIVVREGTK